MEQNEATRRQDLVRLVETYSDMLLRIALNRVDSLAEAEDIVQTVFLKLVRSAPAFRSQEHEKAWLIRTAIRQCLDFNRSAFRRRTLPLDADVRTAFPPETGTVLEAVRQLPELDRYIVYLHYYEGYPIKQIGKLMELPEGTVSSRLSRARKKLKEILKGEGYGTVSECL